MKPGPARTKIVRRGLTLTTTGGLIFGVMWIPIMADVPGDKWVSTFGLLLLLVGIGHLVQADMFKD